MDIMKFLDQFNRELDAKRPDEPLSGCGLRLQLILPVARPDDLARVDQRLQVSRSAGITDPELLLDLLGTHGFVGSLEHPKNLHFVP